MNYYEVNFDGIVGPTHHYGGLAAGNLASQKNRFEVSHPRQAALQGLAKMKLLADLGVQQAVLPPHSRPHWDFLRQQGFSGDARSIIEKAHQQRPDLLSIAYSSAAMWVANAATVSPSRDTGDGRVHITPANLISTPHRALESGETTRILRKIFSDQHHFVVYDPLPGDALLADEGAANHTRLCSSHADPGLEVFVYGSHPDDPQAPTPRKYRARQTRQASERIAALHELPPEHRIFLQQNPVAIDTGVFHNDVIAVGNENVLLCHASSFLDQQTALSELKSAFDGDLIVIEVVERDLTLEEAVSTYLFNSQLITLADESMLLLCPAECESHARAHAVIDRILNEDNPIQQVRFVDVRESMRNGGGPACLRLRVVLSQEELAALQGDILLSDSLYQNLCNWVRRHYRENLTIQDLGQPELAEEVQQAHVELSSILGL